MSRAALTGFAVAISCVWALAQDFSEIKVEQLAKGYTFTEGPAWSKDGYLIFSDTPTDRLLKWVPGHPVEVFRENAGGPSGNAFDAEGRLYTCETRARRVSRTDKKGGVEVVAERWEGSVLKARTDMGGARRATSTLPIRLSVSSRTAASWISMGSTRFRRKRR